MTIEEQIKLIMTKYPETRFDTADFMLKWMEEFLEIKFYITRKEFKEFWENEATLERTRRKILQEPEFKLPPEAEAKRYAKSAEFKREYKPKFENSLPPEEQKQFKEIFGD